MSAPPGVPPPLPLIPVNPEPSPTNVPESVPPLSISPVTFRAPLTSIDPVKTCVSDERLPNAVEPVIAIMPFSSTVNSAIATPPDTKIIDSLVTYKLFHGFVKDPRSWLPDSLGDIFPPTTSPRKEPVNEPLKAEPEILFS
ncbi:MAG TPA: hypothetical protein EYO31_04885, partial [Phycisphaerales bacterium]|nr:hypothetical protein [Phycisphaerales bacterium]